MKILILANNDVGLYHFRRLLMQTLANAGHEIYFSAPYGEKISELKQLGFIYYESNFDRRGINPIKDIALIIQYIRIMRKVKPDKVITYTIKPNIYGGIVCRILKVPFYANVTGLGTAFQGDGILTKLVTLMYKAAFKNVKRVFFENTENKKEIVNRGIVDKKRTCCLNGAGVDPEEFVFAEYPKDGVTRFLFIGRIMKEKGVDELFQAAKRLKKENENIEVGIVGPFEEHYEDTVNKLGKAGIIKYYGYQRDVKPYIRQAHCFVLPSYHEGMANTLLESGAMGRPLITSNIHGCLEALKDEETGYLCKVKDADDLYDKMKRFINLSYEAKKDMGLRSYEYVASVFDKRKVVEKTIREIFDDGTVDQHNNSGI